jgi:hypothetical protein
MRFLCCTGSAAVVRWPGGEYKAKQTLLDARGQGIGTAMLEEICHSLDEFRAASYLETDKWENVGF